MLLEQLQANQGSKIVIELVSGRKISGRLLAVNQQFMRMETDEGVGTIPIHAIHVIWEANARSLTRENMDKLAKQLRDSLKENLACASYPGFTCTQRYNCRPPDSCTYSFSCPGRYVPGFPSGGGGCGPYEFGQPCGTRFGCGPYEFGESCGQRYSCRPYEFGHHCRPRFGCRPHEFGQQCGHRFGCGPYQFGGSQCATPGGFTCAGQQFFGLVGPPGAPGSQCGTVGGFTCGFLQFAGAMAKPPGTISKEAPLPPSDFSMPEESQNKDKKE